MAEPSPLQQRVAQHYSQSTGGDLLAAVLGALETAGTDVSGELHYEDMGSVDHFHGGALAATRALAALGELTAEEQVLDMGGGFGGPARTLAVEYGCHVTVLDPTEPFIRAGRRSPSDWDSGTRLSFPRAADWTCPSPMNASTWSGRRTPA
jgi:hypothetical protein